MFLENLNNKEVERLFNEYGELNNELVEQLLEYKKRALHNINIEELIKTGIPCTPQQVFVLAFILNEAIIKLREEIIRDKKTLNEKKVIKEEIEDFIKKENLSGLLTDELMRPNREKIIQLDNEIKEIKERIETYETLISTYKEKINLCVDFARHLSEEIKNIKRGL